MPWETLQTLSHTLAWTLLHFLWQGAAVGALYLLASRRAKTTRQQHTLALAALLLLLALPIVTFHQLYSAPGPFPPASSVALSADPVDVSPASAGGALSMTAEAAANSEPSRKASATWTYLLVFTWFAGALAIAFRLLRDWRLLRGAIRTGSEPPPELLAMLDRQIRRIGLSRPVRLRLTARITTAGVYGWLRPVILLPTALALCMPRDQLETLLAHELAHIRRADFLSNSLALLARTLLYFHPVVHRVCRDLERTREQLCDDLVVAMDIDRIKYARALSTAESFRQRVTVPVPLLTATGGELSERVHRILDIPAAAHSGRERAPLLLALTATAVTILGLGGTDTARLMNITRPEFQAVYLALTAAPVQPISVPDVSVVPVTRQLPRLSIPGPSATPDPFRVPVRVADPVQPAPPEAVLEPESPAFVVSTPSAPMAMPGIEAEAPPTVDSVALPDAPPSATVDGAGEETAPRPRVVRQVQPDYPHNARWDGVQGSVTLAYRIDDDGVPRDIRVLSAKPAGLFDRATIDALQRWRFAEGAKGEFQQSFDFLLGNGERCSPRIGTRICRP